jgi:hypothetical protein
MSIGSTRKVLDKLLDPRLESDLPNHADLEAKIAHGAAQFVLKGDGLGQQQLPMVSSIRSF